MSVDEAEWATETLKSTGKVVATTLVISPQGDRYGEVTPGEAAVRIAKAGKLVRIETIEAKTARQSVGILSAGLGHACSVSILVR